MSWNHKNRTSSESSLHLYQISYLKVLTVCQLTWRFHQHFSHVSCCTEWQISLTLTSPRDWRLFTAPTIFWWSTFSSLATSRVSTWFFSAINCNNCSPSSAMTVVFRCAFWHASRTYSLVQPKPKLAARFTKPPAERSQCSVPKFTWLLKWDFWRLL